MQTQETSEYRKRRITVRLISVIAQSPFIFPFKWRYSPLNTLLSYFANKKRVISTNYHNAYFGTFLAIDK
jgi:hypothetical protein